MTPAPTAQRTHGRQQPDPTAPALTPTELALFREARRVLAQVLQVTARGTPAYRLDVPAAAEANRCGKRTIAALETLLRHGEAGPADQGAGAA